MTPQPTGTEAKVCELIAARQRLGINKYGTTVAQNPLSLRQWLVHGLEEALDLAVYLQRSIEELDKGADDGNSQSCPRAQVAQDHTFYHHNCANRTAVYDVDSKERLDMVMSITPSTGEVVVAEQPLRVVGGEVAQHIIRFRSIYPIFGGDHWPHLFHCYGRSGPTPHSGAEGVVA